MRKMQKVGIAMPVANEESTIRSFLDGLLQEISQLKYSFNLYVVMDNFSKDRTFDIVKELADQNPIIKLIFYKESTGVVSCYLKGFRNALKDNCDFIIEMDSGGSHPPSKIVSILQNLDQEGYDVIFMSRFMKGAGIENFPFYRKVVSKGGTILANLWLNTNYSDATSGFEAFRKKVLESMDLNAFISNGGIYQTEMKYYCHVGKFKIKELPFVYVGTTTAFKPKWIGIALKTLYRIRFNVKNIFRAHFKH
jgi:dolichol-phosphate mannosyltransferase